MVAVARESVADAVRSFDYEPLRYALTKKAIYGRHERYSQSHGFSKIISDEMRRQFMIERGTDVFRRTNDGLLCLYRKNHEGTLDQLRELYDDVDRVLSFSPMPQKKKKVDCKKIEVVLKRELGRSRFISKR